MYKLTVQARPANSRIRIMNIKPKYRPGIPLEPGKYDILVEQQGYQSARQWVTIQDADVSLDISLEKVSQIPEKTETKSAVKMSASPSWEKPHQSAEKRRRQEAITGFWVAPKNSAAAEITAVEGKLQLTTTRRTTGRVTLDITQIEKNKYAYRGTKGTNYISLQQGQLMLTPSSGAPPYRLFRASKNPKRTHSRTVYVPRAKITGSNWTRFLPAFRIDQQPVSNREFLAFVTSHPQWKRSHIPGDLHDGRYLKHWQDNQTINAKEIDRPVRYVSHYATIAYCEALGKVLPTLTHYLAAEKNSAGKVSISYDATYTTPKLYFMKTEWSNSWWTASERGKKRLPYQHGTIHSSKSGSGYSPAKDMKKTGRSRGFRCITLIEP